MIYFRALFILTLLLSFGLNTFEPRQAEEVSSWSLTLASKHPKQFSFGYANTIATSRWIETVALYGNIDEQPSFQIIFKNLNFITSLNPLFQAPYYLAATLPWSTKSTKESHSLLTKAVESMPEVWYWPYYLGFNTYWFDHDRKKAADYLTQAAALADAPPLVMRLALRMQTDTGQFDTALMFINNQIKNAPDRTTQKQFIQQRITILTERILYNLEVLLDKLSPDQRNQRGVKKLIQSGYHIPRILPDGGHIVFKKDGSLISSKSHKRFKLFIPHKRQGVIQHESTH